MTLHRVTARLAEPYDCDLRIPLDTLLCAVVARRMDLGPIDRDTPAEDLVRVDLPVPWIEAVGAGVYAASSTLDPVGPVDSLTWLAWGRRRQIRNRLRDLHTVDRDGRRQSCPVVGWDIEPVDGDLVHCLVDEGTALRPLPAAWAVNADEASRGAHEPPYWHPSRQATIIRDGNRCELTTAALRAIEVAGRIGSESESAEASDPAPGGRSPRIITASDAEWRALADRAAAAGVSVSAYVRARCL